MFYAVYCLAPFVSGTTLRCLDVVMCLWVGWRGILKRQITLEESNIAFASRRPCTKAVDLMLMSVRVALAHCKLLVCNTANSQDRVSKCVNVHKTLTDIHSTLYSL